MAHGGLIHRLKGYERMLAKTRFLAGDELTVVDMFHIPFGEAMIQVRNAIFAPINGSRRSVPRLSPGHYPVQPLQ